MARRRQVFLVAIPFDGKLRIRAGAGPELDQHDERPDADLALPVRFAGRKRIYE
jgi:hypothetical protein